MTRYERDIYINFLARHIKDEKDKLALRAAENRTKNSPVSPIRK